MIGLPAYARHGFSSEMVYDNCVTGYLGRPILPQWISPMLMRWFRVFLPKEERFFDLFVGIPGRLEGRGGFAGHAAGR